MKKSNLIFALFLIVLTLLPTIVGAMGNCSLESSCCDSTEIPDEKQAEHDCLAFCLCTCCGSSVFFDIKKEKLKVSNQIVSVSFSIFFYQIFPNNSFQADIWQPPKFV